MVNRQALGLDIDDNSKTGGINFDLVTKCIQRGEYDFLIIKAGIDITKSPIFEEQKDNAELRRIPYVTYHLPDPRFDMVKQAQIYVEWVGTEQPVYIVDVEKPAEDRRPRSRGELQRYIDELVRLTKKEPILYSREDLLKEIGFLVDARQFSLWIAQYPFDITKPNPDQTKRVGYRYFHDFTRDFPNMLPPSVFEAGLGENVILWQFSKKGNGPYYIYNLLTGEIPPMQGVKEADLNISIKKRDEFMQSIFGEVPVIEESEDADGVSGRQQNGPTYPGITNQDMLNIIYTAGKPFTNDPWIDLVERANLIHLAVPSDNLDKPYTGLRIEEISSWTAQEKAAVLALVNAPVSGDHAPMPTYPGMTNQDMLNLIFQAAKPFTGSPWKDWVLRAGLEFIGVPTENRRKPYTGPKVENLPNLTQVAKSAISALIK